ncbi:phage integrase: site-specific recombinase [Streptococcus pneumoniae]|nr:phage integrase: site-specific recombinase [Streptococcus pneumoniae]
MKITEYTKKDGSTVYRSSVYLGIDTVTGKESQDDYIRANQERTQSQSATGSNRL